ncbi:hypothetical protein [Agromyces bauzanensis]
MRARANTPATVYLAVVLPVVIALVAAAVQPWLPASDLLRDSQAVAAAHGDEHTAYGLLSNVGILVMALAAGAALVGWLVLRVTPVATAAATPTPNPFRQLLAWSAVMSLVFVLDDLLLLHETAAFLPGIGVLFGAAYALLFLRYVVRFRTTIRDELDAGLLVLAVAALAASVLVDVVMEPTEWSVLIEDGAKLLGIVAWSAFVLRAALTALRPARPRGPAGDPS